MALSLGRAAYAVEELQLDFLFFCMILFSREVLGGWNYPAPSGDGTIPDEVLPRPRRKLMHIYFLFFSTLCPFGTTVPHFPRAVNLLFLRKVARFFRIFVNISLWQTC
jgi:hypothetical protein